MSGDVPPAYAQSTPVVLASVLGEHRAPSANNVNTNGKVFAQPFITGQFGGTLSSIQVKVARVSNNFTKANLKAEVWSTNANGRPGEKTADLTAPSTLSAGNMTFTAPANTTLDGKRQYFLVLYTTTSSDVLTLALQAPGTSVP